MWAQHQNTVTPVTDSSACGAAVEEEEMRVLEEGKPSDEGWGVSRKYLPEKHWMSWAWGRKRAEHHSGKVVGMETRRSVLSLSLIPSNPCSPASSFTSELDCADLDILKTILEGVCPIKHPKVILGIVYLLRLFALEPSDRATFMKMLFPQQDYSQCPFSKWFHHKRCFNFGLRGPQLLCSRLTPSSALRESLLEVLRGLYGMPQSILTHCTISLTPQKTSFWSDT